MGSQEANGQVPGCMIGQEVEGISRVEEDPVPVTAGFVVYGVAQLAEDTERGRGPGGRWVRRDLAPPREIIARRSAAEAGHNLLGNGFGLRGRECLKLALDVGKAGEDLVGALAEELGPAGERAREPLLPLTHEWAECLLLGLANGAADVPPGDDGLVGHGVWLSVRACGVDLGPDLLVLLDHQACDGAGEAGDLAHFPDDYDTPGDQGETVEGAQGQREGGAHLVGHGVALPGLWGFLGGLRIQNGPIWAMAVHGADGPPALHRQYVSMPDRVCP